MHISKRLKQIADLVEDNASIIDVGCDHALLDIYLVNTKKNIKAVASDINEKPLQKAKENIKKYNAKNITVEQGNGIENIKSTTDTIILSGMGTSLILEILFKNKAKLKNIKTIIISSNNDYYLLRKTMQENNYKIVEEKLVIEKNKYYPIIKYKLGKTNFNNDQLEYGPLLIKEQSNELKKYIEEELKKQQNIKKQLPKRYIIKKIKLRKKIRVLKKLNL